MTHGVLRSDTGWITPSQQAKSIRRAQLRQPHRKYNSAACRATEAEAQRLRNRAVVNLPEARQPAEAPSPVPVQHSESYLLRQRRPSEEYDRPRSRAAEEQEPFTGNAIQWTLRKWDQRMKQEELNPSSSTQTAWKVGSGSAGTAAGKGVSAAAKLSLTAGQEIVKAAVPASKWALSQGLALAWKLASGAGKNAQKRKQSD